MSRLLFAADKMFFFFFAMVKHILNTLQCPLNSPFFPLRNEVAERIKMARVRDASLPSVRSQSQMGKDPNWILRGDPGRVDVWQHT